MKEELMEILIKNRKLQDFDEVDTFIDALEELKKYPGISVSELLKLFYDDENIASLDPALVLTHWVETFDGYIYSLVASPMSVYQEGGKWIERLYMRIINSAPHRQELINALKDAPQQRQQLVISILEKLVEEDAERFEVKVIDIKNKINLSNI
jgi:hypothetical protein